MSDETNANAAPSSAKQSNSKPALTIPSPPRSRRRPGADAADGQQTSSTAAPAEPVATAPPQVPASPVSAPPAPPVSAAPPPGTFDTETSNAPAVTAAPAPLAVSPVPEWRTYGAQTPPQPPFQGLPNSFFAPPPPKPIPGVEPKTEILGLRTDAADVEWWQRTTALAMATYNLPRGVLPRIAVEVIKAHFHAILAEAVRHVHGVDIDEQRSPQQ